MKKGIFTILLSGDENGLTLIEVVVALLISVVVMTATLMFFRKTLVDRRRQVAEKEVLIEAAEVFDFLERWLPLAVVNDLPGSLRMHFLGESDRMKFVAPYSPGKGSDLARFGLYLDEKVLKVSVMRVDRDDPTFTFPEGFPGAQPLAENI
ncbi:MAG: prepilin-type N-terminal cleavage/methylation domain-containing protein, partial [Candidatus Omnitrophica bacterium]|nr:prepilin-type N-terminal cleavage/methylation domain-containing protein [Candidatus Omnitrophota bacterium]